MNNQRRDSSHMHETGAEVQLLEGEPTVNRARVETVCPVIQGRKDHAMTTFLHRTDVGWTATGTEEDGICI